MARVGKPRFGLIIQYKSGFERTFWYQSQEAQDRYYRTFKANKLVRNVIRKER
jgi:hypothetical protein